MARETADTVTLHLEPPDGCFDFAPGQFNMLYVFGTGEVAISLSGDPARTGEIVHTVRGVGSVTRPMASFRRGSVLGVRGPFGRGWPVAECPGKHVVVLAGGIGLAPLRPVIWKMLRTRGACRRLTVIYGARHPREILYARELRRWTRAGADVRVTVDHADPGWTGGVGVVTSLLDAITLDPAETIALVCGPEVMIRFAARSLAEQGVGTESVWVSLERNMKCAVGHCGRCQLGPGFVCKDGPVFRLDRIEPFLGVREL